MFVIDSHSLSLSLHLSSKCHEPNFFDIQFSSRAIQWHGVVVCLTFQVEFQISKNFNKIVISSVCQSVGRLS